MGFRAGACSGLLLLLLAEPGGAQSPPSPPIAEPPAQLVSILADGSQAPSLVGLSGEVYRPAGDLRWQRTHSGGVSRDVQAVFQGARGELYALGKRAPLFQREEGSWTVHPLVNRGSLAASPGPAPVAAIGRHIYKLGASGWKRVASTRHSLRLLWSARGKNFYAVDANGNLAYGRGRSWQNISAPLASGDSWVELVGPARGPVLARSAGDRIFLIEGTKTRELALPGAYEDLHIEAAGVHGDQIYLAGQYGDDSHRRSLLLKVEGSALQVEHELWPLADGDHFAIVHDDGQGRLLVASHHGQIRVREAQGTWKNAQLVDNLPAPPPGAKNARPARSGAPP